MKPPRAEIPDPRAPHMEADDELVKLLAAEDPKFPAIMRRLFDEQEKHLWTLTQKLTEAQVLIHDVEQDIGATRRTGRHLLEALQRRQGN